MDRRSIRRQREEAALRLAIQVFEDESNARAWLARPIPSLGAARPNDLLRTEAGYELVIATLNKIQYGIPA